MYEEYWYDALGRRILKRSRQESPICEHPDRCYSAIERYVWDGSQILWEFRQANAGDVKDPASGAQTGHVGYVHAGGIDAPIAMIRNDTALVLHHDYRGLYHAATNTAGASYATDVPWPSDSWALGFQAIDPRETHTWVGSLPMGQQDHTGLAYRRNRYVNSANGQFTQQDPIGFAGGSTCMATRAAIRSTTRIRSGCVTKVLSTITVISGTVSASTATGTGNGGSFRSGWSRRTGEEVGSAARSAEEGRA